MKTNSIYSKRSKSGGKKAQRSRENLKADAAFLMWFGAFALLVTLVYWFNGGKSVFVFPTILCVGLVVRNLRKPTSKYFNNGSRVLPIKRAR